MNLSKSHDPNSFNKILSLHDADKHFRGNDGLSFVQTKLKSLIVRHGVTLVFGVALVHRHFDLDEGTILVEKDNISAPWRYDGSFAKHGGRLIPSAWFYDEGIPRPYEYRFSPYSTADPPTLEEHARFVEEFFSIVNLHGMGSSVGLRLLSGHESTEMLECTEGKVNIMFSSKEVSSLIIFLVYHNPH